MVTLQALERLRNKADIRCFCSILFAGEKKICCTDNNNVKRKNMIGQWIKKKIYNAGYKSGLEEIERFILSLRGQSDEEIGMLLAIANLIRINLINSGRLSVQILNFEVSESEHSQAQMYVSSLVREFQKSNQNTDAAGAMVWLHSLRAQGYPELRIRGRELWSELSRGFEHVREALYDIETMTQKALPELSDEEILFIPGGLEPSS